MQQSWEPEDVIGLWTLFEDDMKRLWNRSGADRLGFAVLLKFFGAESRFPEPGEEVPTAAVSYVAQQVGVSVESWAAHDGRCRAAARHRAEIRDVFGFRANTEADQEKLAEWLTEELCGVGLPRERLAQAVVVRCRNDLIEAPTPEQVSRLVTRAVRGFDMQFYRMTAARLSYATRSLLEGVIAGSEADEKSQEPSPAMSKPYRALPSGMKPVAGSDLPERRGSPPRGEGE
ncbi:DUF4158 domain-containing protein [Streptomyces netropsis]|uniref:DUF4158 domain-containing protein n=1 Tax=Streptomyces netropsis TaxID=55404 RepID=UPI0037AC7828